MVDALVKGTEIPVNDTTTYDNGVKVVPAYLCEVDNIDASNYMKLFESGFYDKADDTMGRNCRVKIAYRQPVYRTSGTRVT